METINNFEGLWEDEESLKMMNIINDQQVLAFNKRQQELEKIEKRKNIKTCVCLIGSIVLFAVIMAWLVVLNGKLNQQEMTSCLENHDQAYCEQNTGWGVR